jgi:hypothetical protein
MADKRIRATNTLNFSIPLTGIENASASFDAAASAISRAFNQTGATATGGDTADLSTQVAALLKSKLDFMASVNVALVENETNKSTFSLLA